MKKYFILFLLILIVVATYYYRDAVARWVDAGKEKLQLAEQQVSSLKSDDLLPPPLRQLNPVNQSNLVQSEVITWTNIQRQQNGNEPKLKENSKLDKAAEAKLKDMFDKQYFEHVSPTGTGPSDLADSAGYDYVLVGENLALGGFKDSRTLVEAWMNSPGHRANILNPRYEEIGVAVGKGQYQGSTVWLAVQEFGQPLSSCPQTDKNLEQQIKANNAAISKMRAQLDGLKRQIDAEQSDDRKRQLVKQYNDLVNTYNNLIDRNKTLIAQYNSQVETFNNCVKG